MSIILPPCQTWIGIGRDPLAGWRVTCLLIKKAPSDESLAYVAAGPLEDLLAFHGPAVIDHVAVAARADERLQLALSGVWLNRASRVWERWFVLTMFLAFVIPDPGRNEVHVSEPF